MTWPRIGTAGRLRLAAAGHNASAVGAARAAVALRTRHGTYLSAAMDRRRVGQGAALGLTEVFEEQRAKGGGGSWLRSYYGTCVSVWYEGPRAAPPGPPCAHQGLARASRGRRHGFS